MNVAKRILKGILALPEAKQVEVLDFVEYLRSRQALTEDKEWADVSLASAMRGMEDETTQYTVEDIRETFS